MFLRSTGASPESPCSGFFGFAIRRKLYMTSSAVRSLPLWNVTPFRRRIVQVVASVFGVISSASTSCGTAPGVWVTRGS